MALKQNGRLLHQMPLRHRAGSTISFEFAETNKASLRNIFTGPIANTSGGPIGALYPAAWLWPQTGGELASHKEMRGVADLSASGAMGVNGVSAITGTADLNATGQVLANMVASLSGSLALSATISIVLNGSAALSTTSELSATATAKGFASASLSGSGAVSGSIRATGAMNCDILPFTELSPQSLAQAVWASDVDESTQSGMGELLLSAGGGSSPELIAAAVWAELLASNNDPGTFGEAIAKIQEELDRKLNTTLFVGLR